jgi:hypothetical protein
MEDHRRVVTRIHVIADLEQTAEGDALTEEGDPDGTGPKLSSEA